ncbi:hypothetical protein BH20GEM1_BH20GEM1_17880 [soil metagenome]
MLEVQRLLFEPGGPIDLLLYRRLIHEWFQGVEIYGTPEAVHPPALFLLLWPVYGWLSPEGTRWLYLLTILPVTAVFAAILLREACPMRPADRALLAILIVACYPTAITIGIGQITLYVMLATLAGMLLALRSPPGAARDVLATGLFLIALIKPNLAVPFFWVIAFRPGTARPVALALLAYLAATATSIALHGTALDEVLALISRWYSVGEGGYTTTGYGNLHAWLGELELEVWAFPASGLVFALQGAWTWRHRGADPWVLIGVAAIVARVWAYHRVYDDLLLVFPLIALYRLARSDPPARGAGPLFALGCIALAAPITAIVEHASWTLVALWLAQLLFLLRHARVQRGVRVATGRISSSSDTPPWRKAP